ncbi:polysaccharide deacetylase family protein [Acuticoccus sp. I52.16.1]|uniref:polysaccharide deacetylase family protein n=1 Tax=Acuticoccus sp. I52.16.1 TaxID=2928472 RepID=UPI001FD53AA6|nr:polysaccharide deacetylase family protein [Acuticoccus sp. I52.16.1]UOM35240.1 polysaccharide deacetylase family protein [Acuticoccus sp. I52.16.1]
MTEPLPGHGRYPYRPVTEPVPYRWPHGEGLAVYVAVNLEAYAFEGAVLDELVANPARPDVINYAWLDYGNRVGAWRLMEAMQDAGVPATCLVNSHLYDAAPGLVDAWRAAGAEIAAHGRTNGETQAGLAEADERALIAEATGEITRREGAPPAGWLGPWIAETRHTPDLLAEAGYRYLLDWCADDRPIAMTTRAGPILAVPYPQEANDANAIVVRRMSAPAFADLCLAQIEEMLHQARTGPLVCAISLHPHVTGQAHRLHAFRDVLTRLAELRERVWLTTAGEIARVAAAGHGV